jgi:YbbR domain-containing protein
MKKILLNNLALKLLSLGFAILLWFIISARGTSEVTFEVPIEYVNIPDGYEILHKERERVNVSIFGSEQILRAVKPTDIRVVIDLKSSAKGKKTYNIIKRNIKVPPAVSVSNVSPSSVEVTLDRSTSRDIPVIPKITGLDKKRYILSVTPNHLKVEGPESILKTVKHLSTEPVTFGELLKAGKMEVAVVKKAEKIRLSADTVEIGIREREKKEGE